MGVLTDYLQKYNYEVEQGFTAGEPDGLRVTWNTGFFDTVADRTIRYDGDLTEGTYAFNLLPAELQVIWFDRLYGAGRVYVADDLEEEDLTFLTENITLQNNLSTRIVPEVFQVLINSEDNLSDAEYDFVAIYSPIVGNAEEITKQLRVRIVKERKNSNFIEENFGITGFSLNDFSNAVTEAIQQKLTDDSTMVVSGAETADLQSGQYYFRYRDDSATALTEVVNNESRFLNRLIGSSAIDYNIYQSPEQKQALLDSPLYNKPTKFAEFPLQEITELTYLSPSEGEWFWSGDLPFSVEDVVLNSYLSFVYAIETDLEDEMLSQTLGELRDMQIPNTISTILPPLLRHYESTLRLQIMKELERVTGELSAEKAQEILDNAEEQANNALEDLATSTIFDQEEEITEETIEKRQKTYKQCALLLNIESLKREFNKKIEYDYDNDDLMHSTGYYNDRLYMIEGSEASNPEQNRAINKLKLPKADRVKSFLDMTPDIHAALQPMIRLFKVSYDQALSKNITHEFPFPSATSKERIDELFKPSTFDRGGGLGIKEFSFSFDGETPATSTNYIRAKLTLFFQSFSDFVKERTVIEADGSEFRFRYLDLFVNTKFCPRSGENAFSPLYYDPTFYRLRADVGWSPRNDAEFTNLLSKRGLSSENFNDALALTNKTFYLNLIDHNIDIGDDGTVTITAEYMAYIEGMLGSSRMNALTTREVKALQKEYVARYEESLINKTCDDKQRAELKNSINALNANTVKTMQQSIVTKLIEHKKLYSVNVDKPSVNKFRNIEFFTSRPKLTPRDSLTDNVPQPSTDNRVALEQSWNYINSNFIQDTDYQNNSKIYFFYMADLVYILLDSLYDENGKQLPEVENVKVILSSFVLTTPFEGDQLINMGQVPVDLETFTTWYKEQIIDKEIENVSIIEFVKRFLFYLVTNIFSDVCINQDQAKRLMFQTTNILAVKDEDSTGDPLGDAAYDPIINIDAAYNADLLPLKTAVPNSSKTDVSNLVSYLVIFPFFKQGKHSGRGIRQIDEANAVYHFDIGAKRGLVKNVSFSKSDIQYIRESRMLSQGQNSLLQLSSVYRCNMRMIGNTLLYPGMEFWLNPFGLGGMEFGFPQDGAGSNENPNLSNIMGIGGYQQVLKVKSTISPGKFETDVEAHFIFSGDETGSTDKKEKVTSLCDRIEDIGTATTETTQCRDLILDVEQDLFELSNYGVPRIEDPE